MIQWKIVCKGKSESIKFLEKRLNTYEKPIIKMVIDQFIKEDYGSKFDSNKLRDTVASYCLFLHGNDGNYKPEWKNNVSFYRKVKDIYPGNKKQLAVNVGFVVLTVQFLWSLYLR